MKRNIDSKLALLISIILGSLVFFLMFLCHKLILCIARAFVYLTGLVTILLVSIFYIFIIIFIISKLQKYFCKYSRYRIYKKNYFNTPNLFNCVIEIESSLILTLLCISICLYILLNLMNSVSISTIDFNILSKISL